MSKRLGLALVVSAPSGAGKTTLLKRLVKECPRLSYSVSYTTRKPRPDEVHGQDYFFVDREEFTRLIGLGFFAEWAEVHGNLYGTPLEWAKRQMSEGRDLLFEIDVQGAEQLKRSLPQGLFVFILPPSRKVLESRLQNRDTDDEETIQKRLAAAPWELSKARMFGAWIVNDDLDKAYAQLKAVYEAEALNPRYWPDLLSDLLKQWGVKSG